MERDKRIMDVFQRDIITIIQAALEEKPGTISADFDLNRGIRFAKEHNVAVLFYYGILQCGISAEDPIVQRFFVDVCKAVLIDQRQMCEIEKLTSAFEQQGIDYLPLKGTILKNIYQKSEMRAMGDADILIRLDQYPQITKIVQDLGYTFNCETDHELVWVKPSLFLELHKSIMTTHNKDFYAYFGTGWGMAEKTPGRSTQYQFKPEDFFIYVFAHFAKHYRISGIGVKHVIDLWVYKQKNPNMDSAYIKSKLKQLGLYEFYKNVVDTLNTWFNNAKPNDKTTLITNVVLSSGQYGTEEMTIINTAIRDSKTSGSIAKTKMKSFTKQVFLPYRQMCKKYPVVKKVPVLLPVMWVVRWGSVLLFRRKDVNRYVKHLNAINSTSVDEHQCALNFVGLDFNFKE